MLSEKPWNLDQAIVLLLGMVACFCGFSLVRDVLFHFIDGAKLNEDNPLYLLFFTLSIPGPILVSIALFLWWRHITLQRAFGFQAANVPRALLFGLPAAILFLPVGLLLQTI